MIRIRLFAILGISFALALVGRKVEITRYQEAVNESSAVICDAVQVRAQGGSTLDVYNQVFSFLRKHSPDSHSSVYVKNGDRDFGSEISTRNPDTIETSCAVENAPDFKIRMRFQRPRWVSIELAQLASGLFLLLLALVFGFEFCVKILGSLWTNEVLGFLRTELGLAPTPERISNSIFMNAAAARVGRWTVGKLGAIKTEIEALNREIQERSKSLQTVESEIENQSRIIEKSKLFEDKVRMVSHDLKGPLSSMKFAIFNKSNERDVLPGIITTVERILEDLKTPGVAKVSNSSNQLQVEILETILKEVVERKWHEIGLASKIKINFQYDSRVLSPVLVNGPYLARIILNLIKNAIEAIGESQGEIVVTVTQDQGRVKISVSDTGRGVSEAIKEKLFEKGVTHGKESGEGLGLHFAKSTIISWGGEIKVESSPGQGSVFTIFLPVVTELSGLFVGPEIVRAMGGMTLIDDEADRLVERWRIPSPGILKTPEEFIDWWDTSGRSSNLPVVVDLNFSDHVSGLDVLREIGKRDWTFISTSDYFNEEMIETARDIGIKIIPKPLI